MDPKLSNQALNNETLIDYHFGTLEPGRRAAVEEALLSSEAALRAFLVVKREIEGASAGGPAPSAQARARLRAAVLEEHGPGPRRAVGRWLGRPVPLYQSLALALVAVVVTVTMGGLRSGAGRGAGAGARPVPAMQGEGPAPAVDSARPEPWSLYVL